MHRIRSTYTVPKLLLRHSWYTHWHCSWAPFDDILLDIWLSPYVSRWGQIFYILVLSGQLIRLCYRLTWSGNRNYQQLNPCFYCPGFWLLLSSLSIYMVSSSIWHVYLSANLCIDESSTFRKPILLCQSLFTSTWATIIHDIIEHRMVDRDDDM